MDDARELSVDRLSLLGTFGLVVDGATVPLPPTGQRLLAFLGLSSPADRHVAAGTLWPDADDTRAAGSLRSALSKLHHLCPRVVLNGGRQLSLSEGVAIDAAELRSLAGRAIAGTDTTVGVAMELLELGGELLPYWDEPWLFFAREELRQIRVQALECCTSSLARAGHHGTAMMLAYEALRCEPLRESTHRQIIGIHLAQGNRAQAIVAFESFARELWQEYGVEPSPLLRQLGETTGLIVEARGPGRVTSGDRSRHVAR